MAETDTEEELPVAYRRLGRMDNGRMGVIYEDEDGNTIPYDELDNYRVNEISGDPVGSDDEEEEEEEALAGPSSPRGSAAQERAEPSDGMNPAHRSSGAALVDPSTGRDPEPYTGPNQWSFMESVQERLSNWLEDSRFMNTANRIASGTEKLTDRAADFMREQELRRQRLAEQGVTTAEEVANKPKEAMSAPVTNSPQITSQPTQDISESIPGAVPGVPTKNVTTQTIPMQANPTVDDVILPGAGQGSIGTLDTRVPSAQGSDFISAALSAPPGPGGGVSPTLAQQIDRGMTPGQVRDQQLLEQEAMRQADPVIEGMGALQDMGSIPDVTQVNVVGGDVGNPEVNRHTQNITPEVKQAVAELAADLGLPEHEVGGIIGTETADAFAPDADNGLGYVGAIQFGPNEQAKYSKEFGKDLREMSFKEQLEGPVRAFLTDRGFTPGMTSEQLYTTIHAGNPYVGMGRKDFANNLTTKQIYDSHIKPRQASYKRYVDTSGRVPGPQTPTIEYDPYSPQSTSDWGGGSTDPWGSLSGGNLSSDPLLGGYGGSQVFDSTPVSRQSLGFTSPTISGPSTSVNTESVTSFGSDRTFGSFGPSTTSFEGGSNSARTEPQGSPSSSSGSGSKPTATPSGGSSSSYGNNDAGSTSRSDGNNPGNDSGGSLSSTERGDGQSGTSGGGGGGSTGNTSHGSESSMQDANDRGMSDLGGGGGWF